MRQYITLKEALDALRRGCVVDELDNRLHRKVVESLSKRRDRYPGGLHPDPALDGGRIVAHIRYVGSREVWWFYCT